MKKILLLLLLMSICSPLSAGTPMFDSKTNNLYLCDSLKYSYTTTNTQSTTYTYQTTSYNYHCYRYGYWFWSWYSCYYSPTTSTYRNTTTTSQTTQHVEDNNSGVSDGFVVLGSASNFPYGYICDRDVYSASWKSVYALCSGFDTKYRNTSRSIVAPSDVQGEYCWKWACREGYAMLSGGECISQSECTSRGLDWNGTTCRPRQFCNGWDGFSVSQHDPILKGSCYEFRCKNGKGFTAAGNYTCQSVSPQYEPAGTIVNNGVNDTGIVTKCSDTQYTYYNNNGRWECRNIKYATKARFDQCWGCRDDTSMIACLAEADNAPVPAGCQFTQ